MGYRVHVHSRDIDTPAVPVADVEIAADYADLDRVRGFARGVDVVTFEFENVPHATAEAAAEHAPVRPAGSVLHTTQHRAREKRFLAAQGFPVAPHARVGSGRCVLEAFVDFALECSVVAARGHAAPRLRRDRLRARAPPRRDPAAC